MRELEADLGIAKTTLSEILMQDLGMKHVVEKSIQMIHKAFRDDAMSAAQIKLWHKYFQDSQESVEGDPCSGRPTTGRTPENVECVWAAVNKDQ